MKRIEYDRYGGPELMHLSRFDAPAVGPGDILVKVEAASINPVDWGIRRGRMRVLTGSSFPRVMGKDLAGTVVEVGQGVVGWQAGDAVFGCVPWTRTGAFSSLALVRARDIVRKPESLSFAQAAALPTIGLTAWHGLIRQARLKPGQSLLVNGAAGGVGSAVVQIAQSLDAMVTARVGSRSFRRMKSMGIETVLDYRESPPTTLDHGFDVIFDCNGSLTAHDIDRLLKPGGVAVDITLKPTKLLRSLVIRRRKLASGMVDQKTLLAVAELAASGKLTPNIGIEVPLEEAIPLITRLEGGERIEGKAVIIFD